MLKGHNILCISSIDWGFVWQGHQEIMSTLAANGNKVLFIENTGVRSPRLSDLPRLRQRFTNWRKGTKGFRQERENLIVYSPLIFPFPYSRVARLINQFFLLRKLRHWMRTTDFHSPIIWTFLPTPITHTLIRELLPTATIYYCIDDLAASSTAARPIVSAEEKLFRTADLVFVTSQKLQERAAKFSSRVHRFPFGVNYQNFENARLGDTQAPHDIESVKRPIAGYIGGIHKWVDLRLLETTAKSLPDVNFVLVGPAQVNIESLSRIPNVHILGIRPHQTLPSYIKRFDVGLIPYKLTEYTANVYPTKLNEYLAMGVPVVATDLSEIRRFNADHSDIVNIATDADAFRHSVESSLTEVGEEAKDRRISVAQQNSWPAKIREMSVLIQNSLKSREKQSKGWEKALQLSYRNARYRLAQTLTALFLVYGGLFHTPLLWVVASPLHVKETPRQVDAIVVFAAGVGESGEAGGGYQERVKKAAELYAENHAKNIVLSSGYVFALQEAEVMKTLAISLDVPQESILLEKKAISTYENVRYVSEMLHDKNWKSILLVSSPYHMRRALLTWRKIAPNVDVIATPVEKSYFYEHGWGANVAQIRGIVHEYAAIVFYWWKGWN